MPRATRVSIPLALLAAVLAAAPALASHSADLHTANLRHVANSPKEGPTSSDLAFWGDLAFAGNYRGFRVIDISSPAAPRVLADVACRGVQSDVSVWRHLLFQSLDGQVTKDGCDGEDDDLGLGFEGIRIFDVSNPAQPTFLKGVATDCGSHTHTLVPAESGDVVYVYVATGFDPGPTCTRPGKITVVEVPVLSPGDSKVVAEPSVLPAEGCHDIGVLMPKRLAAAACYTEGQIWDISDPLRPRILHHIVNPAVNIWHSGAFTWDGKIAVFGDELGGGGLTAGCNTGEAPLGAVWFYRVDDPALPAGHYALPAESRFIAPCTAHNYNLVPLEGRHILSAAWYYGGVVLVDFTDPADPEEIARYWVRPKADDFTTWGSPWSAYWYNGHIYGSDLGRGLDVFALDDPMTATALRLDRMNPQTQEALLRPAPSSPQPVKVLGGRLAATGGGRAQAVAGPSLVVLAALLAAGAGAPSLRRGVRGR